LESPKEEAESEVFDILNQQMWAFQRKESHPGHAKQVLTGREQITAFLEHHYKADQQWNKLKIREICDNTGMKY
jgi:hypothetical protein